MDRLDALIGTVGEQCVSDECIEGLLLGGGAHRKLTAKELAGKIRMELIGIFRVVEQVVDIGVAVCKGRKQESAHRHFHKPVANAFADAVRLLMVGQSRLRQLYRTDCTEDEVVDIFGGIDHFKIITAFFRNVISAVDEDDEVVFRVWEKLDDLVIELVEQFVVLQLTVAKLKQKFLRAALCFFSERKFHREQILSDGTGEGFFQNIKIFEHFFI